MHSRGGWDVRDIALRLRLEFDTVAAFVESRYGRDVAA